MERRRNVVGTVARSILEAKKKEDAILELERSGCFRAQKPSSGHDYALWRIEKGRLASFAK